jgi:hypothetical protein
VAPGIPVLTTRQPTFFVPPTSDKKIGTQQHHKE